MAARRGRRDRDGRGGARVAGARTLLGGGRRQAGGAPQARGPSDRYTSGALPLSARARHADRQEVRRGTDPLRVSRGHRADGIRRAFGSGDREPSLMRAGVGAGGAGRRDMGIVGRGVLVPALLAVALAAGSAAADNNPAGLAFRAVGWFKGKADISQDGIK